MNNILFTAAGCIRCKIVKGFMKDRGIPFEEKDMKAEGKEEFKKFYSANRTAIYRGPDGIEFPVFTDGVHIRQGIGTVVAYLNSGNKLDGFFSVGTLHKEWVDGIHISAGKPECYEDFLEVLRFLKANAMKLQVDTNGKNSSILRQIFDEGLADVVIMNVVGPRTLYRQILDEAVDLSEVEASIAMVPKFPKYQFQTTVVPVIRQDGDTPVISYMTPEETGETARLIEEATGSKKNPYLIRLFKPEEVIDSRLKSVEPMSANMIFSYRSAARVYQVFSEVEKS